MKKRAIYAGTFDIFTNGHLDILTRALKIFDEVVVLVAVPPEKKTLFTSHERVEMLKLLFKDQKRVVVDSYDGLVVNYAKKNRINSLIRGLRPTGDFENEFQLASMNRKLNEDIEVVFLMTSGENYCISSSNVREVLRHHGSIDQFVPEAIGNYIKNKKRE